MYLPLHLSITAQNCKVNSIETFSFRFLVNFIGAVAIRRVLLHEVLGNPNIDPVGQLNASVHSAVRGQGSVSVATGRSLLQQSTYLWKIKIKGELNDSMVYA